MSILAPPAPVPMPLLPTRREWTREEFYRLGDLGFFQGQRTELLEGEIVVQSPQSWPHASTTDRVFNVLKEKLGAGFWVRMQLPLFLGPKSEPEPDISVVSGRIEDYADHPTTAVLLVETSETTLASDKTVKASLYASARMPDYWIIDLVHRKLIVMRTPKPDATQLYGATYADVMILDPTATISPLALPQAVIRVADLLP